MQREIEEYFSIILPRLYIQVFVHMTKQCLGTTRVMIIE
jgi:hypothetical protein